MKIFREATELWQKSKREHSVSLQLRLLTFFIIFIVILASAFFLIMTAFGVFQIGADESLAWTESELNHLKSSISSDFGNLSMRGTSFTKQLNGDINNWCSNNSIDATLLRENPEALEELLGSQMPLLLSTIENTECTGVFLILDATVNPTLENAQDSKAGIFLKRTEPNAVSLIGSKIHYLRGPASVARQNGVELLGQWQMEFDTKGFDFFEKALKAARENPDLSMSRLYHWTERLKLKGNSESGMLLCMPLTSADGKIFGICGMEISSMHFKLNYSPDGSRYPRIFAALSPVGTEGIDTARGLIAGNSFLTNPDAGIISISSQKKSGLTFYNSQYGTSYVGLHEYIKLYPSGSAFSDEQWILSVMIPETDWKEAVSRNKMYIYLAVIALLIFSTMLAFYISKKYLTPVNKAIDMIKSDSAVGASKTNILEIDDLLEYLSHADSSSSSAGSAGSYISAGGDKAPESASEAAPEVNLSAYKEFVKNIATLSKAERAVYNLYMEDYTAGEIAKILGLSMNTIKTHNKRIYTKLNVTSRKELMIYVQMMSQEEEEDEY